MKIRTLLVDDEPAALRGLSLCLQNEADIEIVGNCHDGVAAIEAIAELKPDLVFLDIQMPEINGFDVIDAIGLKHMPTLIFVTAYDHFALRAFNVHAIDYVLKPIDQDRFKLALDRARQNIAQTNVQLQERLLAVLSDLTTHQTQPWSKRLAVKLNGRVVLVQLSEVTRIEVGGNYAEIYVGGKTYLIRETLSNLERRLNPIHFSRISRSTIVNIEHVREVQTAIHGDFIVVLKDDSQIKGSRRYREMLDNLL